MSKNTFRTIFDHLELTWVPIQLIFQVLHLHGRRMGVAWESHGIVNPKIEPLLSEPSDQCHLSTASSGIEEKEPKISRQVETGTTTTELTKASKAASSTDTCIPQPPISSDIFAFGVIAILICKPSIVKNILKKYEKSSKRSKIYVDPIAEALSKAEKRDKYIEILKQEKSTKLLGNLIELCCGKERAHSISCKSLLKNEALIDVPTLKLISCRRLIENESDQIYTNVEDEGNTPIISWISLRSGKEKYLTTFEGVSKTIVCCMCVKWTPQGTVHLATTITKPPPP